MTRTSLVASLSLGTFIASATAAEAQDLSPPSTGPATGGTAEVVVVPASPAPGERLEGEEKKDSGRGLEWFYLQANAGYSYANMASLSNSSLAVTNTESSGPAFGFGAGIRLFVVTIGAQATLNELSTFNLWQIDGQLGFHIPIGHWEPYFGLHGGYCFVGALDDGLSGSPNVSITGGDAGLQLGLDYYFNHFLSLGIEANASILFLNRPPTTLPAAVEAQLTPSQQSAYQQSGDSVGLGVIGSAHLGLHL